MSGTLTLLDRLISFDTVSARSNLDLIAYCEAFLTTRGFRVTRLHDPDAPKAGLYAEIGPAGRGILLSGHTDVVPVEGQRWTRPPFLLTAEGDMLYGRGATDMKGFVAAMLHAADAASRAPLKEPIKLVLSYDEEVGCVGLARMQDRLRPLLGQPRLGIVGEPTEMQVAIGHKGKRAYHATLRGEAGHSALAPNYVNALNVTADFIQALQGIGADLASDGPQDPDYDIPYSTVHVGMASGGRALNVVPEEAQMTFELRHIAATDPDLVEERMRAVAKQVASRYGTGDWIEIRQTNSYPGHDIAPGDAAVAEAMRLAQSQTTKVAFGTEAGYFAALEVPTVVCGPGSMAGQGHKPDEYLTRPQLAACDAMLARVVDRLIEGQITGPG